eukprot:CFRG4676T1
MDFMMITPRTESGPTATGNSTPSPVPPSSTPQAKKIVMDQSVPRMDAEGEGYDEEGALLIRNQTKVGPYRLVQILGTGSTGQVCLGIHMKTKEEVAVKVIPKVRFNRDRELHDKVEREIAIMKLINHPHVLSLLDVYESENNLFLVLEYVSGGELFDYLAVRGRLSESEALKFFQQLISAVEFCHLHHICHRDLKPENLLMDKNDNLKIADFGLAAFQANTDLLLDQSCGTPHYASPEVIRDVKYDGRAADVWSCGVILFALLTGHLPFDDDNLSRLLTKVKAGLFAVPTYISKEVQFILRRILYVNPNKRFTIADIKKNKWFQSNGLLDTFPVPTETSNFPAVSMDIPLDPDVLSTLMNLGCFKDELDLRKMLCQQDSNIEKMVYYLLLERKLLRPAVKDVEVDDEIGSPSSFRSQFERKTSLRTNLLSGCGSEDVDASRKESIESKTTSYEKKENIRKRTDSNLSLTHSQSQFLSRNLSQQRYMSMDAAMNMLSAIEVDHHPDASHHHQDIMECDMNKKSNTNRERADVYSSTPVISHTASIDMDSVKSVGNFENGDANPQTKPGTIYKKFVGLNSDMVEANRRSLRRPSKRIPIPLESIEGSAENMSVSDGKIGTVCDSPKFLWFQDLFGDNNIRIVSDDVPRENLLKCLFVIIEDAGFGYQKAEQGSKCSVVCTMNGTAKFKMDVIPTPEKDSFVIMMSHVNGDPGLFLRIVDTVKANV